MLIHGIGEQKPMGTLRPFVDAVTGTTKDNVQYYSKPDEMSELFELRRLQAKGYPKTDFFEYYWAYNIRGTKVLDVLLWMLELCVRSRKNVPQGLLFLWVMFRAIIISIVIAIAAGVFTKIFNWNSGLEKFGTASVLILLGLVTLQYFFVSYLGDAARYLSPRPKNIRLRQKIRGEGVKLLKTLQNRREYDRIIIVGHSLGSVIGYDIITLLWHESHADTSNLKNDSELNQYLSRCMSKKRQVQPEIRNRIAKAGDDLLDCSDDELDKLQLDFRRAQKSAFLEQKRLGFNWSITEFVTLGSPLSHSMMLLASNREDLHRRTLERELPTCPPQKDDKGYAFSSPTHIEVAPHEDLQPGGRQKQTVKRFVPLLLHHAAPFAVTRWTNLYFPVRAGLFGDPVGGPLARTLGKGILDIKVSTKKWAGVASWLPISHILYWNSAVNKEPTEEGSNQSTKILIDTLDLGGLRKWKVKPLD